MTAQELIDKIAPQHDRTSCNDSSHVNGFCAKHSDFEDLKSIDTKYNCRCARCGLLDIVSGRINPTNEIYSITFHLNQTK